MAIASSADNDPDVARHIADGFVTSLGDLLPPGNGIVEVRFGAALQRVLTDRGWTDDDPWIPFRREMTMRRMACSSATVATPSSNAAAVATYTVAGFVAQGGVTDFRRP